RATRARRRAPCRESPTPRCGPRRGTAPAGKPRAPARDCARSAGWCRHSAPASGSARPARAPPRDRALPQARRGTAGRVRRRARGEAEQVASGGEGGGDADALLLAARELPRQAVGKLRQTDQLELPKRLDSDLALVLPAAPPAQQGGRERRAIVAAAADHDV